MKKKWRKWMIVCENEKSLEHDAVALESTMRSHSLVRDGKCDTLAAIIPVKIFPFLRGISLKLVKNGLKMKKTRQN